MNIYINNISRYIVQNEIKEIFGRFGFVSKVKIIRDKKTGVPKGYGFVEMPVKNQAQEAITKLNGKSIDGKRLEVKQTKPKIQIVRQSSAPNIAAVFN